MLTAITRPATRRTAQRQRGLSVVELLVGVAVGLFIVAGVVTLFVSHLTNSRRLLVEARVNQDLRVAADLISRDLRRAAYWGNAIRGTVIPTGATTPMRNPYQDVTANATSIGYAFSRDAENDAVDGNEQFGFRRSSGGAIQMLTSAGNWQTVTDPGVVVIPSNGLQITATETVIPAGGACFQSCPASDPSCPTITVRQYDITLTGQAANDANVVRTLRTRARMRNDLLAGTCPP